MATDTPSSNLPAPASEVVPGLGDILETRVLHRSLAEAPPRVLSAKGIYLHLEDDRKVIDATGGAAVACLGHGNGRIAQAILNQASTLAYCHTTFFGSEPLETLAQVMVDSTYGDMSRAYFVSSGSEALESALKYARQYHLEKKPAEPARIHFISRQQSYHGATLGALGVGGFEARRRHFEPMLNPHTSRVSPCFPYRAPDISDKAYVAQLEQELEDEFQKYGPGTIAAFIAEPVVGAAIGCVAPVKGYFQAMRRVCDRHGALLILDEIMCGCGRIGPEPTPRYPEPLHAYQDPDIGGGIVPDIVTMGKSLGAGYQAIGAMLINHKLSDVLAKGSGVFVHGHTYQGHAVACRAALEVQRVIRENNLLHNIREQGRLLGELLHQKLDSHAHVGDVRGRGLFWAVEFVLNKTSKQPFDVAVGVAVGVHSLGLQAPHNICLYPSSGTADGLHGDHVIVAPAYNCTAQDITVIVSKVTDVIESYFQPFLQSSG